MEGEVQPTDVGFIESDSKEAGAPEEDQILTLRQLLAVLFRPQTLPHLFLLIVISSILFLVATKVAAFHASIGFMAMSLSYALLAYLNKVDFVNKLTVYRSGEDNPKRGALHTLLSSFKICILPSVVGIVFFLAFLTQFGEHGPFSGIGSLFPLGLGSLFVIWAIIQGRSFSTLSHMLATKKPSSNGVKEDAKPRVVFSFLLHLTLVTGVVLLIDSIIERRLNVWETFSTYGVYLMLVILLYAVAMYYTKPERLRSVTLTPLRSYTRRYLFLMNAMIAWHFLSIWRQLFVNQPLISMVEELMLMTTTVLLAIWSATSKSMNSSVQLLNKDNALFFGISFGFAYGGSVAMLTATLDDVQSVMIAGHVVVILTLLRVQKTSLQYHMRIRDSSIEVRRVIHQDMERKQRVDSASSEQASISATDPHIAPPIQTDGDWGVSKVIEGATWDEPVELVEP